VSPRLATARLLERSLWMPEVGDLLAMQITIQGKVAGERRGYVFSVLDRYDHEGGVSAMARTTGYTAAIVAGMLAEGEIGETGVVPPERLGMNQGFTEKLLRELKKRDIVIGESRV
jgi:lysine 6-dehydrogenase